MQHRGRLDPLFDGVDIAVVDEYTAKVCAAAGIRTRSGEALRRTFAMAEQRAATAHTDTKETP